MMMMIYDDDDDDDDDDDFFLSNRHKAAAPAPSLVRLCRAAREGGLPPIPPLLRLRRAGRGGRRLVRMLSLRRVVAFEPATTEAAAEKGKGQKATTQERLNCMNTTRRG